MRPVGTRCDELAIITAGDDAIATRGARENAREGIGACASLTLGDAAFEALADFIFRQVTTDEDDPAVAFLVRTPRTLVIAIENHVNPLEHETLWIIFE